MTSYICCPRQDYEMFLCFEAARVQNDRTDETNYGMQAGMRLSGEQTAAIMQPG